MLGTGNVSVDSAIDAGTYIISISISYDQENYILRNLDIGTLQYVVDPQVIDSSVFVWDYAEPYIYSGSAHLPILVDFVDFASVAYSYYKEGEMDSSINAGEYQAIASLTSTDPNYIFSQTEIVLNYVIEKAIIDLSGVVWNYEDDQKIPYDGFEHKAVLINLPSSVTETYLYTLNGNLTESAVNIGVY